ncbi:MAG: hypothetical protein JW910_22325 [Anaerolineae bacterium]|nr:hypothetical protein [Anaerolineae bacterium]
MPWTVDTVAGNVPNLPDVLAAIRDLSGLKPFLTFELETRHGLVPVALVQCGAQSLELLGQAQGEHPAGLGHISRVTVEVPNRQEAVREIAPGLTLCVRPGPKARLAGVEVVSGTVEADAAILQTACGVDVTGSAACVLVFGEVEVRFTPGDTPPPDLPREYDPDQRLPGWHRLGLAHPRLEAAVAALRAAGAVEIVPPYRVLPGLREAMLRLPSGLLVQPVEQSLARMLPVIGVKLVQRALTGQPVRFRSTNVGA